MQLRFNWILPRPTLAGGIKSDRLIAEAMVRRGHEVNLIYRSGGLPWPSPLRVRTFAKRLKHELQTRGRQPHHLEHSTANLVPVHGNDVQAEDAPDADFCIGSWWAVREAIESWPPCKGLKIHYVRGYEIWVPEVERVRAVYRLPGLKIVVSRWLQRVLTDEYGARDVLLIPNGVDRSQFNSVPRRRNRAPTVGMLYSRKLLKGIPTAFEAIKLVQRSIHNLRVTSFGADPLRRNPVPPQNFQFHLRPPQASLAMLYRSCDCWIVASRTEGLPMPGLEAAACRCPLVATRCGGTEDYVVHGENGFLVGVGEARLMADRIREILCAPEEEWRRMSEASYRISRDFDWDRSAEMLENALRKLVKCPVARRNRALSAARIINHPQSGWL